MSLIIGFIIWSQLIVSFLVFVLGVIVYDKNKEYEVKLSNIIIVSKY